MFHITNLSLRGVWCLVGVVVSLGSLARLARVLAESALRFLCPSFGLAPVPRLVAALAVDSAVALVDFGSADSVFLAAVAPFVVAVGLSDFVVDFAVAAVAEDAAAAEPTEVNVTLTEVGGTKVAVIKAVREITGLGLVDAKGLVDKVPAVIKEKVSADEAKTIKEKLEAAGATVEVK